MDPDEVYNKSSEWMSTIDRGGLKHVTNMMYRMFISMYISIFFSFEHSELDGKLAL